MQLRASATGHQCHETTLGDKSSRPEPRPNQPLMRRLRSRPPRVQNLHRAMLRSRPGLAKTTPRSWNAPAQFGLLSAHYPAYGPPDFPGYPALGAVVLVGEADGRLRRPRPGTAADDDRWVRPLDGLGSHVVGLGSLAVDLGQLPS